VSGLFETLRVREGRIPFLAEHLARLGAGLWRLGLEAAPPGLDHRLRSLADAGESVLRVTIDAAGERIETRAVPPEGPLSVVTSATAHRPYPLKSTERTVFEEARAAAEARGAAEALLLTADGFLAEGTISSLFFWSDELLCTPDLGLGILPGVGRARVMALARGAGIPVAEGRFAPAALAEGRATPFLVNAVRGVIAVSSLDGAPLREDPRTTALAAGFWG
jgi:branched-subunit amino acid aminotransferase/4-amino-4-deoxychorismate lyase